MTLTEFLLARIDEDEAVARAAGDVPLASFRESIEWANAHRRYGEPPRDVEDDAALHWSVGKPGGYDECRIDLGLGTIYDEGGHWHEQAAHIVRHDPARVLAECEAKRNLLMSYDDLAATCDHLPWVMTGGCCQCGVIGHALLAFAAIYADHPDYQQEWAL